MLTNSGITDRLGFTILLPEPLRVCPDNAEACDARVDEDVPVPGTAPVLVLFPPGLVSVALGPATPSSYPGDRVTKTVTSRVVVEVTTPDKRHSPADVRWGRLASPSTSSVLVSVSRGSVTIVPLRRGTPLLCDTAVALVLLPLSIAKTWPRA